MDLVPDEQYCKEKLQDSSFQTDAYYYIAKINLNALNFLKKKIQSL